MRLLITLSLLSISATGALAADVKATSRTEAVIVYPSGAEVTRIGKVKLESGDHTLLFADLPSSAVAASIRVEGKATGRLEIGSVDTHAVSVPRSDEAAAASDRRRVEEAIDKLKDERSALQAAGLAAETQKKLIDNLAQLPARPAPTAGAPATEPDWAQLFALIGQRAAEAQMAILNTQIKIREVDHQIKDQEGKLASLAPTQNSRTELKVYVNAASPLEADIVIRYQVRSASWSPYYDARLSTGTKTEAPKLQLVRRASIQQSSGESWDNVALALSTAQPAADTAAPMLNPMIVDHESGAPPLARPQEGQTRGCFGDKGLPADGVDRAGARSAGEAKVAREAVAVDETNARVEVQTFQAVYAINGRVTVPATGEMKRVQIDDMQLEPSLVVRTVPKRQEKAYLYVKLTTARGTPLLPGQVSLFRDTTFVGNGRLPLLAPGEEHELGFGVDDAIRVRYTIVEEKRSESGIITSSKTDVGGYRITVKNQHERAISLTLLDQIPVSQNADIKVELTGKTAAHQARRR